MTEMDEKERVCWHECVCSGTLVFLSWKHGCTAYQDLVFAFVGQVAVVVGDSVLQVVGSSRLHSLLRQ